MFDFKINLVLGSIFQEIKTGLVQIDTMHLGLYINDLRYKTEKESKKKK